MWFSAGKQRIIAWRRCDFVKQNHADVVHRAANQKWPCLPVYEDARIVQEAAKADNNTGEGGQDTQKSQEGIENREQYAKMVSEIKAAGKFAENAKVHIPPQNVVLEALAFDDNHINGEREHNVSREMAEGWIRESKASVTVWDGQFEKYYGVNGVVYVDKGENKIRTAFGSSEFDEKTRKILEVFEKYED